MLEYSVLHNEEHLQTSSSWSAEQRVDTVLVIVPHVSLSSK
jgi:hypothetical protein